MQSTRQKVIKLYRQLSSTPSTAMRRSETWTTSFQRPNDLIQDASRPKNETSTGNGSRSISVTGSSNVRALQRSLSDIFGPNKIVVDAHDEVSHESREVAFSQTPFVRSSLPQTLTLPMSTSSSPSVSKHTPFAVQPGQPHPKAMSWRQWSLVSVPESDPSREIQLSSVHPDVDDRRSKVTVTAPGSTSVDENQNIIGPVALDSSQCHRNTEGELKMAAGERKSQGHVMQVPETVVGHPSRKFWIMQLLGAGEKKNVRNKDVNMMAPQSW